MSQPSPQLRQVVMRPWNQRYDSKACSRLVGATHRVHVQRWRVFGELTHGPSPRDARTDLRNQSARQQQHCSHVCGQCHALMHPGSLVGVTHRARVQQRQKSAFWWSRLAVRAARATRLGATGEFLMQTALRGLRSSHDLTVPPHVVLRLTT